MAAAAGVAVDKVAAAAWDNAERFAGSTGQAEQPGGPPRLRRLDRCVCGCVTVRGPMRRTDDEQDDAPHAVKPDGATGPGSWRVPPARSALPLAALAPAGHLPTDTVAGDLAATELETAAPPPPPPCSSSTRRDRAGASARRGTRRGRRRQRPDHDHHHGAPAHDQAPAPEASASSGDDAADATPRRPSAHRATGHGAADHRAAVAPPARPRPAA